MTGPLSYHAQKITWLCSEKGEAMATVIYERGFEMEGVEARAVIVDHSQLDRLELHFGITERSSSGGPEVVTYRNQVQQACAQVSRTVRRAALPIGSPLGRVSKRYLRSSNEPNPCSRSRRA